MASTWRLLLPDGKDDDLSIAVETKLSEDSRVEIEIDEGGYTLRNCGTTTVMVLCDNEEEPLDSEESRELTRECAFYLIDQKESTLHRVVSGRIKRRKVVESMPRYGFQLYRLRKDRDRALAAHETDLAAWFDGDVTYACLSDFMIDLDWLISAVPSFRDIPRILILHGEMHDDHLKQSIRKQGLHQIRLHRPPLPIPFGTHHSKACILKFPTGLRVIVHTANLIYCDCGEKTQGAWIQDFPHKTTSSVVSEFEEDLLRYLKALKIPPVELKELLGIIGQHDFSAAGVKLISSVPGYHKGEAMKQYGHMLMRETLSKEIFSDACIAAPLVCQFSSLGSLDQKWLFDEFVVSLGAGKVENNMENLGLPSRTPSGLQLIWPTVDQVRHSLEGWAAGRSIPGPSKNIQKPFLKQHWHLFNGDHLNRTRAMPHIKTYARYSASSLAWILLTSSNLSKAAWGVLQKKGTQLMVRSYELGVLFLPSLEHRRAQSSNGNFSCTAASTGTTPPSEIQFVPFPAEGEKVTSAVQFCLPYEIPPKPYGSEAAPWMVDLPVAGLDVLGRSWGHGPPMYGLLEPDAPV